MNNFLSKIKNIEEDNRVAFTSKHPLFLPLVLESRRLIRSVIYKFHPKFRLKNLEQAKWYQITEHSSPLFRKYNKRELDLGKIENIKIAIKNLDGIIIPPQKVFSFWKHVGRPSSKRGFRNGLVVSNGKLKDDVGGGLCQLSNLIAYMFACSECEFVERKHHCKDVFPDSNRVVPFASGATVFYNLIDLKIKNPYLFPIKLNLRTTETQLRGSISVSSKIDYYVKLEEKESYFIKSKSTGKLYRCNELDRVFYDKTAKTKIKDEPLWLNVAEVVYEESLVKQEIHERVIK